MEIEPLRAMSEGMYPGLMTMIEAIALITTFFAIVGIAICLAGITWLCFQETRQPASRRTKPSEPDESEQLEALAAKINHSPVCIPLPMAARLGKQDAA